MPDGSTDAIGPGVATADYHDVLARGINKIAIFVMIQQRLRIGGEKFHGKMNALEFTPFNGQIPRTGGPGGQHHGVKFFQ